MWSFQPETTPRPRTSSEIPTKLPESLALSKALRAELFAFVGPTTMYALTDAIGMVDTHQLDSHRRNSSGRAADDVAHPVWVPLNAGGRDPAFTRPRVGSREAASGGRVSKNEFMRREHLASVPWA